MNGEPGAALDEELARRIKDAVDAGAFAKGERVEALGLREKAVEGGVVRTRGPLPRHGRGGLRAGAGDGVTR